MAREVVAPYGTVQTIDYTSTSASTVNAFGAQTKVVMISANSPINYRIYDGTASSTCTSNDPFLPLNWVLPIGVTPGQRCSIIKASGGSVTSADGRAWIVELF